mmetsp:Transcript_28806/g.64385  ORF Transcript_28806/g.64385 Transcript_28806/m.64385 type:complete len:326 (+) Transcript_28806:312-1289(+)
MPKSQRASGPSQKRSSSVAPPAEMRTDSYRSSCSKPHRMSYKTSSGRSSSESSEFNSVSSAKLAREFLPSSSANISEACAKGRSEPKSSLKGPPPVFKAEEDEEDAFRELAVCWRRRAAAAATAARASASSRSCCVGSVFPESQLVLESCDPPERLDLRFEVGLGSLAGSLPPLNSAVLSVRSRFSKLKDLISYTPVRLLSISTLTMPFQSGSATVTSCPYLELLGFTIRATSPVLKGLTPAVARAFHFAAADAAAIWSRSCRMSVFISSSSLSWSSSRLRRSASISSSLSSAANTAVRSVAPRSAFVSLGLILVFFEVGWRDSA